MDKKIIFSESIIFSTIEDSDLTEIILRLLDENEKRKKTAFKSNRGGYQTDPIDNFYLNKSFTTEALRCLQNNYNITKQAKLNLLNLWINKNYKGSFNVPHVHPKSNFSGIFYVEVAEKDGQLIFIRNDKSNSFTDNSYFFNGLDFNVTYDIQPKKNMFIIFPSHLDHMVMPHFDDKPRISVSFNFELCND
jgi:uncharacterized protein (TIGR02466 family)